MQHARPRLVVYSSVFPNSKYPNAGVFIKERMFRVREHLPLVVVSPVPWFPFQWIVNRWKPGFRPQPERRAEQDGVSIYYPRFLSVPRYLKFLDGIFMAMCSLPVLYRIRRERGFDLIDAHFAYPDGYAAALLGKWFRVPVTITLRGTEVPLTKFPLRRMLMLKAIGMAARVFSVSDSLKRHVVSLGADANKIRVIGNGVDLQKFRPVDKARARMELDIAPDAKVLITVGGLVPRKGFHRVIDVLPELIGRYPDLIYLVVGGSSPEGNIRARLERQALALGLQDRVRFLGALPPERLRYPLSAADVFVLATANEGWANVILEAMACGLPVVATDVGGNREVLPDENLGTIVPFGDSAGLARALCQALDRPWHREKILAYADRNSWASRVAVLATEFDEAVRRAGSG